MDSSPNRRTNYRRFSDRRVALLLNIYEILFDTIPGPARDKAILDRICLEYGTDRALIVIPKINDTQATVISCSDNWLTPPTNQTLKGPGITHLIKLHKSAEDGSITFTKFRRPNIFPAEIWFPFWEKELFEPTTALLSSPINSKLETPAMLWLMLNTSSREWSSHDRTLAEELTKLLAKARDKR